MPLNRKDLIFLLGLLLSLFIFYPELFLAKAASLIGDHWEQHFPWAYLMDHSLSQGKFPFWTSFIHCGFPIAAEGQIGLFYLPNLALYLLLPFQWAYSYLNVFHFLIAAWSTYLYCRVVRLSPSSSFLAAFVFTFGTAYGGAYYNITSLKTISWFPLCLFLFEKYLSEKKIRYLGILAVVLSQLLIAGYLQVAILLYLIFGLYCLLRILFFQETNQNLSNHLKILIALGFGFLLAFLIALPQIYLTYELAIRSNRIGLTEDYAYIGSMSPLAISTFLVAIAQGFCRGNSIYGGVFSMILVLFSLLSKNSRSNKIVKLWIWIAVLSLFLALGRWSPVYVAVIKLTHFYSFRTPMKFLVFICFSLAVLTGFGFEEVLKRREKPDRSLDDRVTKFYLAMVSGFVAVFTAIYLGLTVFRAYIIRFGDFIIRQFIYGHVGRPHSLEEYHQKLIGFLDLFLSVYSLRRFWTVWTIAVIAVSVLFVLLLKLKSQFRKVWLIFGFLFLFVDLYTFAWFDIKKDFNFYDQIPNSFPILEQLKAEKNSGTLGRLYGFRTPEDPLPLIPSVNMLYGMEDIGAYSPFIIKRYYDTIGTFGNINDSNAAFSPTAQYVLERLPLLSALGVSHILSKTEIKNPALKLLMHDPVSESYLYRNKQPHSKIFFVTKMESYSNWIELKNDLLTPGFDPAKKLLLEQSEIKKLGADIVLKSGPARTAIQHEIAEDEHDVWNVETSKPGFFVVMDSMYPGWIATLNGKEIPVLYGYGLFKAVWIGQPGKYQVIFRYSPFKRHLARS